jgi:hypothetical protein
MTKKTKMQNYEPPFAKDISVNFAKGQVSPMGVCKSGAVPYYSCVVGPGVLPSCNPGGTPDTSKCGGGFYHFEPACRVGVVAATVCGSGQGQQ